LYKYPGPDDSPTMNVTHEFQYELIVVYVYQLFNERSDCKVPDQNLWIPNQSYDHIFPETYGFQQCIGVYCDNGVLQTDVTGGLD